MDSEFSFKFSGKHDGNIRFGALFSKVAGTKLSFHHVRSSGSFSFFLQQLQPAILLLKGPRHGCFQEKFTLIYFCI